MCPLAHAVLALAITHAPPGRSPHSYEAMPQCGTDARHASCEIAPVCDEPIPVCAAPRWNRPRKAWVRNETYETGVRRYARIADVIADTATRLVSCKDPSGRVDPECEPTDWPDSERMLALSALAAALHESGLREDIQFGHPPLGRGAAGEACLLQVNDEQAPLHAHWLPEAERARIVRNPILRERFARSLLGDSPEALRRCFEIGMRMLVRARTACSSGRVPWEHGMFAMYGTGSRCRLPDVADKRQQTFERLRADKAILPPEINALVGWNQCSTEGPFVSREELPLAD